MLKQLFSKLKSEPAELAALRAVVALNDADEKFLHEITGQRAAIETAVSTTRQDFYANPGPDTLAAFIAANDKASQIHTLNQAQELHTACTNDRVMKRTRPVLLAALTVISKQLNVEKERQSDDHDAAANTLGLTGKVGANPIVGAIEGKMKELKRYVTLFTDEDSTSFDSVAELKTAIQLALQ